MLVNAERPCVLLGSQVWTSRGDRRGRSTSCATLNIPAYMNGAGRGTLPPGDPHHFHLTRRYAFDNADVIVIVGTPFDFRMGYGKRLSPRRHGRPDRPRLPHRRQEPRHRPRPRRRCRASILARGRHRPRQGAATTARAARKAWLERPARRGADSLIEKRLPQPHVRRSADPPAAARARDQRVPHRGHDLHRRRRRHRHLLRRRRAAASRPGHWMDPGPLGTLGVGMPVRDGGQARPARQGGRVPLRRRRVHPDRLGLRDAASASTCRSSASSATTRQ